MSGSAISKMCASDTRARSFHMTKSSHYIADCNTRWKKDEGTKFQHTHTQRASAREDERVCVRVYVRERQRLVPLYLFLLKIFYKVNQYRFFGFLARSVAPLHRQQMLYVKNSPQTHLQTLAYTPKRTRSHRFLLDEREKRAISLGVCSLCSSCFALFFFSEEWTKKLITDFSLPIFFFVWPIEIERSRFPNSFFSRLIKSPKEGNENLTRTARNPMNTHCSRFCACMYAWLVYLWFCVCASVSFGDSLIEFTMRPCEFMAHWTFQHYAQAGSSYL